MKPTFLLSLPLAWCALTNVAHAEAAADEAALPLAHIVAPSGTRLMDAEPGELPSVQHPEGTVYGVADEPAGTPNVVLMDVRSGAVLARSAMACTQILHAGSRVFGACADAIVEFDRDLGLLERTEVAACPVSTSSAPRSYYRRLFFDGADRVVAFRVCDDELFIRVADVARHRYLGGISMGSTNRWSRHDAIQLYFHGQTVLGVFTYGWAVPQYAFVLSPDFSRIAHEAHGWFDDDGVHLHEHTKNGRDVTLSDAFVRVSSGPLKQAALVRSPPTPRGLGGSLLDYEFPLGAERFFVTRTCCGAGSETKPGLYVLP